MTKAKIMRVERNWFLRTRKELFEKQNAEGANRYGFFDNHTVIEPTDEILCDFSGDAIETPYVDVYVSSHGKEYALSNAKSEELQKRGLKVEMHESTMTDADPGSQI